MYAEVSALLDCHLRWDEAMQTRSTALFNQVQSLKDLGGWDVLPSLSQQDLRDNQKKDADLVRVVFFVEWRCKPP